MPRPVWPAALPQKMRPGVAIEQVDLRSRFEPDVGPPRMAVVSTGEVRRWRVSMTMSESQLDILRDFVRVSCFRGTLPFDWVGPITGSVTVVFQWDSLPVETFRSKLTPVPSVQGGAQIWAAGGPAQQILVDVQFSLLQLPWLPAVP